MIREVVASGHLSPFHRRRPPTASADLNATSSSSPLALKPCVIQLSLSIFYVDVVSDEASYQGLMMTP